MPTPNGQGAARNPKRGRRLGVVLVSVVFIAGILFAGLFSTGLAYTNEMDFCVSCHSLQIPYEEYKESLHYKNQSGVQATCADCHVPKPFIPKMIAKVVAMKDVYHEIAGTIDTPEKFEAHRWDMASRVWARMERNDSRECRSCHEFSNMDLSEQGRSARSRHASAEERGKTCIDCHKGIVHYEPYEPDDE